MRSVGRVDLNEVRRPPSLEHQTCQRREPATSRRVRGLAVAFGSWSYGGRGLTTVEAWRTDSAGHCDSRSVKRPSGVDRAFSEPLDDVTLLRAVGRGDETALAELYDLHAGWLTLRLSRRCGSAELVDEALQDTFLAVWRQARHYQGQGDVGAYIWGSGIRRLINAIRREARSGTGRAWWVPSWGGRDELVRSAEDEVLLGVEHGRLGEALDCLSPELRTALAATAIDGLSCAEAARLLGVPVGTVKSRFHRARIELRETLL